MRNERLLLPLHQAPTALPPLPSMNLRPVPMAASISRSTIQLFSGCCCSTADFEITCTQPHGTMLIKSGAPAAGSRAECALGTHPLLMPFDPGIGLP